MRCSIPCALLLALIAAAGCGESGDPSTSGTHGLFKSQAHAGTGAPVKIARTLNPGDGIRMTIQVQGDMRLSGTVEQTIPMGMTMVMRLTCAEVQETGDRVLNLRVESLHMPSAGLQLTGPADQGPTGRLIVDPSGRVTTLDLDTMDRRVRPQVERVLRGAGYGVSLPTPPEGLRVGQAVDLTKVPHAKSLEAVVGAPVPGSEHAPEIQGEYVLTGIGEIDGEPAAEFAINIFMRMTARSDTKTSVTGGIRMSGSQRLSIRTGLPIGPAETHVHVDLTRTSGTGGTVRMQMDMDLTIMSVSLPAR